MPMPNWNELVRGRLGPLGVDPHREEEIVAELAVHLEDFAANFRQQGMAEDESTLKALATVADWTALRRGICSAEKEGNLMRNFRKHVWLPGLSCLQVLVLVWVAWFLLAPLFLHSFLRPSDWKILASFWFLAFVGLGALAAHESKRAGGNRRERVVAALFFPIGLTAAMIVGLPLRAMTVGQVFDPYIGQFALFAILFPTAALVLGTIPFLRRNPS